MTQQHRISSASAVKHLARTARVSSLASLFVVAALSAACGAANPPKELLDARAVYTRVAAGPAKELAPAELDTAKQSLGRAEGSFQEDGDSPRTRDLAYIAERRTLQADAQAGIIQAERDREQVDKDLKKAQLATIDKTRAELDSERRAKEASTLEAKQSKADLEKEKKAREEAEKRAAAAMASLAEVAKVKEESRGVVITLSGAVLFATGKSELLPIAREKLTEVARAVKDQGFKEIVVEGHTDAQGSAIKNEALSLARAESVRSHLVGQGIPPDKIRATGLGSNRPVAENTTAEGRANNRRVEIVVSPLK